MTEEQKILIELDLCHAIRTFHDLSDKETRETYCKNYFWEFCKENQLNPKEVFDYMRKVLIDKDFDESIHSIDQEITERD